MTRQSSLIASGVAALLIGLSAQANAATITSLYNTGVDASHNPLSGGSSDPNYKVVASPLGAFTPVSETTGAPVSTVYIHPSGSPQNPAEWIGPVAPHGTENFTAPAGNLTTMQEIYDYQTSFTIGSGFNPLTAVITGQMAFDNDLLAIKINGFSIPLPGLPGNNSPTAYQSFYDFSISSHILAGPNTIDFVIRNDAVNLSNPHPLPNPTALLVQMTGTVDPASSAVPEPASLFVFGTFGVLGFVGYGRRRRNEK